MPNRKSLSTGIVIALVAALALVVIAVISLSGDDDGVDQSGLERASSPADAEAIVLFRDNCGQCHALTVADTDGAIGPDLDDNLFTEQRTRNAIAEGPGRMSANILEGEDADAVARLVGNDEVLLGKPPAVPENPTEDSLGGP